MESKPKRPTSRSQKSRAGVSNSGASQASSAAKASSQSKQTQTQAQNVETTVAIEVQQHQATVNSDVQEAQASPAIEVQQAQAPPAIEVQQAQAPVAIEVEQDQAPVAIEVEQTQATISDAVPSSEEVAEASGSESSGVTEEETWSFWDLLKWCPASKKILQDAENNILSSLRTPHNRGYVNVGPVVGDEDCKIWTLRLGENSNEIPIVFIHGFASGLALWVLNYDTLAQRRPVYGLDLLGFGQSSRPKFSSDAKEAEDQFVNSIEAWRYIMKIPKFILVGHSLGGFLATSYAIRYPEAVQHLLLADPWGFVEEPLLPKMSAHLPYYLMCFLKMCESEPFNFDRLWPMRLPGRMGPKCLQLFRSDLIEHFVHAVPDAKTNISNYIFQCNILTPSGESAFKSMTKSLAWAKNPIHSRLTDMDTDIPMTLIYGGKSWVDHLSFEEIVQKRRSPFVYVHVLEDAGHNVYAGRSTEKFNEILINACALTKAVVVEPFSSSASMSNPQPKLHGFEPNDSI